MADHFKKEDYLKMLDKALKPQRLGGLGDRLRQAIGKPKEVK